MEVGPTLKSRVAGKEKAGSKSATETAENVWVSEVLSVYPGYTTAGATFTSVTDPAKLYSTNIQRAKDGDPSAAYKMEGS